MSTSFSFIGVYHFASKTEIDEARAELREVLEEEHEVPDPFATGEIGIDGADVRFAVAGPKPSSSFDFYETIVETFADHAESGAVTVTCDGVVEVYEP